MTEASCETTFGKPLILQGVKAQGQIEGRLLEMTLEQRYRNPLGINVEVVYTFPLPYSARRLAQSTRKPSRRGTRASWSTSTRTAATHWNWAT